MWGWGWGYWGWGCFSFQAAMGVPALLWADLTPDHLDQLDQAEDEATTHRILCEVRTRTGCAVPWSGAPLLQQLVPMPRLP